MARLILLTTLATIACLLSPSTGTCQVQSSPDDLHPSLKLNEPSTRTQSGNAASARHHSRKADADDDDDDPLTEHQSVDAFTSLEDGQPGVPGEFEAVMTFEWATLSSHRDRGQRAHVGAYGLGKSSNDDAFGLEGEIRYTLKGSEFLNNMQLNLAVPLELGDGRVDGNGDVTLGWRQRWVKGTDTTPTLSTLADVRVPTWDSSSGVDGMLTGVIAQELGCGTLYFNAFAKSANGDNIEDVRHFQWGFRTGYKWRVCEPFSLIGAFVNQSSEQVGHGNLNVLELAGEYQVSDHLIIGPGIHIGLDRHDETPNFGAGITLNYSF